MCLKGKVEVEHGFLKLYNRNVNFVGGRVEKLAENWELKKVRFFSLLIALVRVKSYLILYTWSFYPYACVSVHINFPDFFALDEAIP
jgi:hypothetical protein